MLARAARRLRPHYDAMTIVDDVDDDVMTIADDVDDDVKHR